MVESIYIYNNNNTNFYSKNKFIINIEYALIFYIRKNIIYVFKILHINN